MKKWVLTAAVLVVLIAIWATKFLWLSPVTAYLGNSHKGLENLYYLAGVLVGIVALLGVFARLRPKKKGGKPPSGTQTIQNATAGRDAIQAGHNVVTGGTNVEGGGIGRVHGDNVKGDKVTIIHQESTPPPASPTPSALHQLPAPPRDFTGREAELRELLAAVEKGGVTISGLRGMGGIGKTALALKLADQLRARYPDAQIYLNLKGTSDKPVAAAEAMAHVIRSYRPDYKPPESEAELSAHYHSVLDGQRAILLMDNAREAAQVSPLLPSAPCVMLVTSRWHFTLPGWKAKDLSALPPDDAENLLLAIAPRINGHATAIAKLCGFLPLALRAAASAIAETPDLSPAEYSERLEQTRRRLELSDSSVDQTVEASLALSYELLGPEFQRQFRALAVFPETFDVEGAAAVWAGERDPAHDALSTLVKYSLVDWVDAKKRYSLHDLVRDFAASKLSDDENIRAKRRHAEHYLAVASAADDLHRKGGDAILQGLQLFDTEWGNILAGQAWAAAAAAQDKTAAHLACRYPIAAILCLNLRQHPRESILWLEAGLAAAGRLKDRRAEGAHLGNLGIVYWRLGDTRRAIEFYEKALAISREMEDRQGEGNSLGNLGNAHKDLGELRCAIKFYDQHLVIAREIGDRRGEGSTLGNLGNAYRNLGEPQRAIGFYEHHLVIAREIGDRRGVGYALGNLGNAYGDLGETRRAIEFYEKALAIDREMGDRRGEGITLWNLSLELDKLGDRAQAIVHAEAALKILDAIEDPHAAKVRTALAQWRGQD